MSHPPAQASDGKAVRGDRDWLTTAIELSRLCPPSPSAYSVGAVIVAADGMEIARGYSRQSDPHIHAEEAALAAIGPSDPRLAGATLYSSLEPCTERRSRPRTCTQLILGSGLRRVVIAWREPPLLIADGRGVEVLREAGLTVIEIPDLAASAATINAHLAGWTF